MLAAYPVRTTAEISPTHFDDVAFCEKDVLSFQIAVEYIHIVEILDGKSDLHKPFHNLLLLEEDATLCLDPTMSKD